MARVYEDWAQFEGRAGRNDECKKLESRAEEAYDQAARLDPDNSHLLENRARRNLRIAEAMPIGEERVARIVDALAWLHRELYIERALGRDPLILEAIGQAYELLEAGEGAMILRQLAAKGFEAANIALARLFMRELIEDQQPDAIDKRSTCLERSHKQLLRVPEFSRSWRWYSAFYEIESELHPFDLESRLETLEQLEGTDFIWPTQLRLERAILLHQVGRHPNGREAFSEIRNSGSSSMSVPYSLRLLLDPRSNYRSPLLTAITVAPTDRIDRNVWGIPDDWGSVKVPLRLHMFPYDRVQSGQIIPCLIQFTLFGPQAVPPVQSEVSA
jgi:hypothetical protein